MSPFRDELAAAHAQIERLQVENQELERRLRATEEAEATPSVDVHPLRNEILRLKRTTQGFVILAAYVSMFVTLCVVSSRLPTTTTVVAESCAPAPSIIASLGAFDPDAAAASLEQVTLDHCTQFGPVGSGRVRVTFSGGGDVHRSSVTRSSPATTEAAACVARAYSSAKVPPFSGPPVTVVKRFNAPDAMMATPPAADIGWPPPYEF